MIRLDDSANASLAQQPTNSVEVCDSEIVTTDPNGSSVPALIAEAGASANFAWEEFIYGKTRNPHTRDAYERAIRQFLKHCKSLGRQLPNVSPRDVEGTIAEIQSALCLVNSMKSNCTEAKKNVDNVRESIGKIESTIREKLRDLRNQLKLSSV